MSSQNLHYRIACASLKEQPIRLTLESPATVLSDEGRGHLAPAPNEQFFAIATGDWGDEGEKLLHLAETADETLIYSLLSSQSNDNFNIGSGVLANHAIIKRALAKATQDNEIWSPILNLLAYGRHSQSRYERTTGYWSRERLDNIKAQHPELEILPTPGTWLLGAAPWVAATHANVILERIKTQHPDPWHPVMAAHASPITSELVDFLLPVQKSMLTLIARNLTEEDYVVILRRTLHRLTKDDEEYRTNHRPYGYYQSQSQPQSTLPILHRDPDTNHLDNEREIFARVTGRLGYIPQAIRAELDTAAQYADTQAGKPIMSGAQLLRATDQTVPGAEFVPLLDNSKAASLAPLTGHREFITLAKADYYQKLLYKAPHTYYAPNLQRMLLKERTIDPRVLMDIAAEALAPDNSGRRDSGAIIDVLKHPSADLAILRHVAATCDMTPVKVALAKHPVARHDPEIRPILMRMRIPEITAPLLLDAPPADCLDLWQKLIRAAPSEALDLLEQGKLPAGFSVPHVTIAPILKSGDKNLIIRALRVTKLLSSNTAMSAKDTARSKSAKLVIRKVR